MSTSTNVRMPRSFGEIRVTVGEDTYKPATRENNWERREYPVTITYRGRSMRIHYSQGMGHAAGDVDPKSVLSSIVLDARTAEEQFEDWCGELGYDSDSRTAWKTYRACVSIRERIERVFGRTTPVFMQWASELDA